MKSDKYCRKYFFYLKKLGQNLSVRVMRNTDKNWNGLIKSNMLAWEILGTTQNSLLKNAVYSMIGPSQRFM